MRIGESTSLPPVRPGFNCWTWCHLWVEFVHVVGSCPCFERLPREKLLGLRTRTNNKLNLDVTLSLGIEPKPHWWEASALTTATSLLLSSKTNISKFQFDLESVPNKCSVLNAVTNKVICIFCLFILIRWWSNGHQYNTLIKHVDRENKGN